MNTSIYQLLTQNEIFRMLTAEELHQTFLCVHYGVRKHRPSELIAVAGDLCQNLMIILSGRVRGDMIEPGGKMVTVEEIEAPRAIAPAFLFGKNNRFPVNVTTLTETAILYIPRDSFISLLQKDSRILISYLNLMSNRSFFLAEKVKFHSLYTIRQKIARYLLENTQMKNAVAFDPGINQTMMAEMFGVARPSLARTFGELSNEGIIEYSPRWIKVLNFEALNKILTGNED